MAFASINCYQESANISNQSGTDNPCNQIYNGSYASTVNATGRYDPNGQNFMDVNYTKPVGATNNSIWQVEHGEASVATLNPITPRPPYNITIPSACWNAYPNLLRLRFTSYTGGDDAAGKVASWPSCWNGTDFTFVGNNYSTNQVILLQNEVFIPTFWRDGNWSTFSSRLAFNNDWQDGAQPGVLFSKEGDAEVFEEAMWWTIGMSITLNAPADSASLTSATTTLNFTAIDPSVSSFACSLNQDGSITQTNSSVSNNTLTTFTVIGLTDGTHTWKINCSDGTDSITSSQQSFTVTTSPPPPPPSGGGSGTGGGSVVPTEPQAPPPSEAPPTPPTPTQPSPSYYSNPPDTSGQPAIFGISDKIVAASQGQIGSLPYACSPTFLNIFNFIGADLADRFICEIKGILSLYIKKSIYLNLFIVGLILMAVWTNDAKKKSDSAARESQKKSAQAIYAVLLVTTVAIFVIGFDFLSFIFTAFILFASGKAVT